MNINDLRVKIRGESPHLFDSISDTKAAALLRESFKQIVAELHSIEDGSVRVSGLGHFRVKQVVREHGGKKETIKRIVFRPAEPKVYE